jgi:hypothetical protein
VNRACRTVAQLVLLPFLASAWPLAVIAGEPIIVESVLLTPVEEV